MMDPSTTSRLQDLEARLTSLAAESPHHPDQDLGIIACWEALAAAQAGNYGVGAVLVAPDSTIVAQGRNAVFFPGFRSDLHAEMVVMNAFEARHPTLETMRGYTLLCSLEPCVMCLARLLTAGVQTVKFLAYDELGGMVQHMHRLPLAWQRLGQRQQFVEADVSPSLRQFALAVFLLNLDACRQKLLAR
jgi:tRNA(Arg) A34 adenosine deaminase TadA